MYITYDNIKCQGHILQVKFEVFLGIKSLQTVYYTPSRCRFFRSFLSKRCYHFDTKYALE